MVGSGRENEGLNHPNSGHQKTPMWLCQSRPQKETYVTLKRKMEKSWIKGQFTKGNTELRKCTRDSKTPGASNHGRPFTLTALNRQEQGLVTGTWPEL